MFFGTFHQFALIVLVDSDSTYHFIQTRVASYLGMTIRPLPSFYVMISDDQKFCREGLCKNLVLHIQGIDFVGSCYVLSI